MGGGFESLDGGVDGVAVLAFEDCFQPLGGIVDVFGLGGIEQVAIGLQGRRERAQRAARLDPVESLRYE